MCAVVQTLFWVAKLLECLSAEPAPPPLADQVLADMIVARVDAQVITLSDLRRETCMFVLEKRKEDISHFASVPHPLLIAVLRHRIHRDLILGELGRLGLAEPDVQARAQRLSTLRAYFETPATFKAFAVRCGFSWPEQNGAASWPPQMLAWVEAEQEAARYLSLRLRKQIRLDEQTVVDCYQKNKEYFGDRPLNAVATQIRLRLREEAEHTLLLTLLEQIRTQTKLWFAPEFSSAQDVEPLGGAFSCANSRV